MEAAEKGQVSRKNRSQSGKVDGGVGQRERECRGWGRMGGRKEKEAGPQTGEFGPIHTF